MLKPDVLPGHEIDVSGENLVQKSVPRREGGGALCDERAKPDGWKCVRVRSGGRWIDVDGPSAAR